MKRLISLMTLVVIFAALAAYAGPQGWGQKAHRPCDPVMKQLTEEQREEFRTEMRALCQSGATWEERQAAARSRLESYGVDVPEDWRGLRGYHRPPRLRMIMSQLNDEQRTTLDNRVTELRADNATREQIQSEVDKLLDGWGIKRPAGCGYRSGQNPSGESPG